MGGYALVGVADPRSGSHIIQVFDIGDPAAPHRIGQVAGPGSPGRAAIADGRLFLATRDGAITVFEVTDPTNPRPLARLDTAGDAGDLALADGLVYVADHAGGLLIARLDAAPVIDTPTPATTPPPRPSETAVPTSTASPTPSTRPCYLPLLMAHAPPGASLTKRR
jgi:hypothetical protein